MTAMFFWSLACIFSSLVEHNLAYQVFESCCSLVCAICNDDHYIIVKSEDWKLIYGITKRFTAPVTK
jgi:hypothetical protein